MRYQRYQTYLQNTLGIADTRTPEIAEAMDKLHSALCKLDNENMRNFAQVKLFEHLNTFSCSEGLRQLYDGLVEKPYKHGSGARLDEVEPGITWKVKDTTPQG